MLWREIHAHSRPGFGECTPSPSPCLSSAGLPGQAEHSEQPALPEQALTTVARLIEALEKQGRGSQGACRACVRPPCPTHSHRCP